MRSAEEGLELERERDESHVWGSVPGSGLELGTEVQIWAGRQEFQTHVTQGLRFPSLGNSYWSTSEGGKPAGSLDIPTSLPLSDILELTQTWKSKLH